MICVYANSTSLASFQPHPTDILLFLEHTRHILALEAWHYFHSCLKCCSPDIYVGNPHFCKSLSKCSFLLGPTLCNPLLCSCLENPRDRGAWWAAIYGVTQSWTQLKRLSSSNSMTTQFNRYSLSHQPHSAVPLYLLYVFFFPFSIEICHFLKCQIIYYFTVCIVSFLSPLITI